MKRQIAGLVLSEGSFVFIKLPRFRQSSPHHYLLHDLNNHPSWVDYKVEYGEDVIQFVSRFRDLKSKD